MSHLFNKTASCTPPPQKKSEKLYFYLYTAVLQDITCNLQAHLPFKQIKIHNDTKIAKLNSWKLCNEKSYATLIMLPYFFMHCGEMYLYTARCSSFPKSLPL